MNSPLQPLELTLAAPRGFCAGVERAILIVEEALRKFGAPVYVRHEVVHNRFVVDDLRRQGAIFVDELEEVPDGARVIFSAHGVSKSVQEEARRRGLNVLDATCPLVTKVHIEVARMRAAGFEVVMIGHRGHPEVAGTMGQSSNGMYLVESCKDVSQLTVLQPQKLAYVTQTTLSIDDAAEIVAALKDKFPGITAPKKEDICYATQNRQSAVKALVVDCDLVLVVGARNSSNSNRLREVAENHGRTAYLVEEASELDPQWLVGKSRVVITAGASTPEEIVQNLVARINTLVGNEVTVKQHQAARETVIFPLPKELAST